MQAPIALFVYNRPKHTKLVMEALFKNQLASKSDLYIFVDALKEEADTKQKDTHKELLKYIKNISGFKKVEIVERIKNEGLSSSIKKGITDVLSINEKVIILEDDIVTSPVFLDYINSALKLYEEDMEVISISGWMYDIKSLPPFFFLKGADCWGWATWKRGWKLYNDDAAYLADEITRKQLIKDFNFEDSYPYYQLLLKQKENNSSWAIKWYASAYLMNKYTLYPGQSYVANIGQDISGTNFKNEIYPTKKLSLINNVKKIPIVESKNCKREIGNYLRNPKKSVAKYISYKINKLIS